MIKFLSKNLQDIDYRNKNVKFSVWSGDLWLTLGEKKAHFEKRPLEICIVIEIFWCKYIKCYKRNT